MPAHIINTFRGGQSPETNRGPAGSFKNAYSVDIRKDDDTLSCGQRMIKESSTTVVDLVMYMVVCSDAKTYAFGDAGKIYQRTSAGVWSLLTTDADGAIKGAAEWNSKIYWATDTKLKSTPISSVNFAAPTTVSSGLTSATTHAMKQVAGAMYLCNSTTIGIIDTSHVFSATALQLPPDVISTALDERDGFMIIGIKKNNNVAESFLFMWDTTSLTWNKRFRISSDNIHSMISGEIMLAHAGESLYFSDLAHNIPLFKIASSSMNNDAICTKDGLVLLGLTGATVPGIYSYGRKKENMPMVLNIEYILSAASITGIGSVKTYGSLVLCSWKTAGAFGVDVLDTANKAAARYESLEWYVPPSQIRPVQVNTIKLIHKALPASCVIAVQYKLDKASSWIDATNIASGATTFSTTGAVESYWSTNHEAMNIYEIAISLTPSGNTTPDIERIETSLLVPPEQIPFPKRK
jgi:hypothetical protein